ncbi:four helix bundle protein [Candidatus Parcubacteria bacterium]|nr:four helix bundle protein [Candidatus Parcubacteria bacterium]
MHSYKDLIVWQKGIDLVAAVYDFTKDFPKEEMFGLSSQIKRAAVSLPANIAEGRHRGSRKDFLHFVRIAYASGAELETEIYIAERLRLGNPDKLDKVRKILDEEMKMLHVMIGKLRV